MNMIYLSPTNYNGRPPDFLEGHKHLYSDSAIAVLSATAGRKLSKSNIQGCVRKLKNKHIITHYGHKYYIELPGFIQYLKSQIPPSNVRLAT